MQSPQIPFQITKELKEKIIAKLEERGATLPCPRCGNQTFSVIDGFFNQTIQATLDGFVLGGPSVPTAIIACNHCGYLSQHAIGVLGLLPLLSNNSASDEVKK